MARAENDTPLTVPCGAVGYAVLHDGLDPQRADRAGAGGCMAFTSTNLIEPPQGTTAGASLQD